MDRHSTFPTHPRPYVSAEVHVQETSIARSLIARRDLYSCHRERPKFFVAHLRVITHEGTGALALLGPVHCATDAVISTLLRALQPLPP